MFYVNLKSLCNFSFSNLNVEVMSTFIDRSMNCIGNNTFIIIKCTY
jgi:hypothetical protein